MNRKYWSGVAAALVFAAALCHAEAPENLLRKAKLSADSHFLSFTPDKAADGDAVSKESRWVSGDKSAAHWLMAEFESPRKVNAVTVCFWSDTYLSEDFDLEGRLPEGWKTLREVRGNAARTVELVFKTAEFSALRFKFRKQISDDMVRLSEVVARNLPHAVEAELSPTHGRGILADGEVRSLVLRCYDDGEAVPFKVSRELLSGGNVVASLAEDAEVSGEKVFPLPAPDRYGSYSYRIGVSGPDGKVIVSRSESFYHLPPGKARYRSSSPFGTHYYHASDALVDYIGLSWWRNHDVYGRWNQNMSSDGKETSGQFDERLDFVRKNGVRECAVLLGAPKCYSTILPGEPVESDVSYLYSYYSPADFEAWKELYLKPVAEKVSKNSPFRVYEVWNEAWSYYRLRGLRGTAGEAMELFRISYETLKKADPAAMVYPTDVKPEMVETPYGFKSFGRDMLDLGFLRWADLLSYHSYGMMTAGHMEALRRNLWDYGRDLEMWSTETATAGEPFHRLMESLLSHRSWGNGKTFIYNGDRWAPLYTDSRPTMNLVGQAALIRALGDALPIGVSDEGGVRGYLLANGGTPVAVLFTDSPTALKISVPLSEKSVVTDVFGALLDPEQPVLSAGIPVIVIDPAPAYVKKLAAGQIAFYAKQSEEPRIAGQLNSIAAGIAGAGDLKSAVPEAIRKLSALRTSADSETLYRTNPVMDVLTSVRIMLARSSGAAGKPQVSLEALRNMVDAEWRAINAVTKGEGALLDTERLTSRAQKEMQYAMQYDSDGDAVARDIWIERAADDLFNAGTRREKEKVSPIYRTKSYFRSQKRLIRSELYCFPNGRPQEAVITLANPFGRELSGTLVLTLPGAWQADRTELPYRVAPFSRTLLSVNLTAPEKFEPKQVETIQIRDRAGQFPDIDATCEVVEKVPAYPVLGGALSSGTYTGN